MTLPRHRFRLVIVLALMTGAVSAGVLLGEGATAGTGLGPSEPRDVVSSGTATATRTVEVAGVTWNVVHRDSSEGPCIGVVAEMDGVEEGQVGGGCGESDDPALRWGIGGIEVKGQWFNVAYGKVPAAAASVRVILGDGSVVVDSGVQGNGIWVVVIPADPFDKATDIARLEVVGGAGIAITDVAPPSLVDLRNDAREERVSHSSP